MKLKEIVKVFHRKTHFITIWKRRGNVKNPFFGEIVSRDGKSEEHTPYKSNMDDAIKLAKNASKRWIRARL